jgi:hypothetical protein
VVAPRQPEGRIGGVTVELEVRDGRGFGEIKLRRGELRVGALLSGLILVRWRRIQDLPGMVWP